MALFSRKSKQQQSVLPEEVNQYYQSQRRERAGVAIILGIVALVVTLLIGLALFFGGRALYNRFSDNDEPKKINTISETAKKDSESKDGTSSQGQTNSDNTAPKPEPTPTPAPEPAPVPPTPTPTPAPQPTTPSLGDEEVTLPRTGDEGL